MPISKLVMSTCPLVATLLKFKVTVVVYVGSPPADTVLAEALYTLKFVL